MRISIPREEWPSFCSQFGKQHQHWLVTLGELPTELADAGDPLRAPGARLIAQEVALQEIGLGGVGPNHGWPGGRNSAGPVLRITAGHGPERLTLEVDGLNRLSLEQTTEGAHRGLRIDSAGGRTTLLRFRSAVAPEAVDGMP